MCGVVRTPSTATAALVADRTVTPMPRARKPSRRDQATLRAVHATAQPGTLSHTLGALAATTATRPVRDALRTFADTGHLTPAAAGHLHAVLARNPHLDTDELDDIAATGGRRATTAIRALLSRPDTHADTVTAWWPTESRAQVVADAVWAVPGIESWAVARAEAISKDRVDTAILRSPHTTWSARTAAAVRIVTRLPADATLASIPAAVRRDLRWTMTASAAAHTAVLAAAPTQVAHGLEGLVTVPDPNTGPLPQTDRGPRQARTAVLAWLRGGERSTTDLLTVASYDVHHAAAIAEYGPAQPGRDTLAARHINDAVAHQILDAYPDSPTVAVAAFYAPAAGTPVRRRAALTIAATPAPRDRPRTDPAAAGGATPGGVVTENTRRLAGLDPDIVCRLGYDTDHDTPGAGAQFRVDYTRARTGRTSLAPSIPTAWSVPDADVTAAHAHAVVGTLNDTTLHTTETLWLATQPLLTLGLARRVCREYGRVAASTIYAPPGLADACSTYLAHLEQLHAARLRSWTGQDRDAAKGTVPASGEPTWAQTLTESGLAAAMLRFNYRSPEPAAIYVTSGPIASAAVHGLDQIRGADDPAPVLSHPEALATLNRLAEQVDKPLAELVTLVDATLM